MSTSNSPSKNEKSYLALKVVSKTKEGFQHNKYLIGLFVLCFFGTLIFVGPLLPFLMIVCGVTVCAYQLEDYILYNPDIPPLSRIFVSVPSIYGLPYESIYTYTNDGTKVHLFVITQPKQKSKEVPTILFLHGNAGNIGHRLDNALGFYRHLQCNLVMLEYRGYGLSQGHPSEKGLYLDAQAALDYIASRQDVNHKKIIVFGRSLGGAVGIEIASSPVYAPKIYCLIVENSFTSIPDMALALLGWRIFKRLPLFCYKSKFLSNTKISKVKVPILFVSGLADALVPPKMMRELYDLAVESSFKQFIEFPSGSHNETWHCNGYYEGISHFISKMDTDLQRKTVI